MSDSWKVGRFQDDYVESVRLCIVTKGKLQLSFEQVADGSTTPLGHNDRHSRQNGEERKKERR